MSQFDFNPAMLPLTHNLLRYGAGAGTGNADSQILQSLQTPLPGANPAAGANQLQMAQNLAVAKRQRGQTATSGTDPSGQSPTTRAILEAKAAWMDGNLGNVGDMTEDQRTAMGKLRDNPRVSLNQFRQAMRMTPTQKAAAAPAPDAGPGSISISSGNGPNQMTPEQIEAWRNRAASTPGAPAGEQVSPVQRTTGEFQQGANPQDTAIERAVGQTQYRPVGQAGFDVTGVNGPQPQPPVNPAAQVLAAFQGHLNDDQMGQLQAFAQSGATPQQLYNAAQHLVTQQATSANQASRADMTARHQHLMDLHRQRSDLMKQGQYAVDFAGDESQFSGDDPQTQGMRSLFAKYKQNEKDTEAAESESAPAQQQTSQSHIPQPQFDAQGKIVAGSRGVISPDLAGHYLSRVGGDMEKAKQAARLEGWNVP